MLKNKKTLYVLVPLVLIIWGVIGNRIYQSMKDDNPGYYMEQASSKPVIEVLEPDTFSIIAEYRDPFLGRIRSSKPKTVQSKKKPTPIKKKPEPILRWPSITYGGMIRNQKTGKLVAMIKINGKDNLLSVGNVVSEVRLVQVYPDSIKVALGNVEKMVVK